MAQVCLDTPKLRKPGNMVGITLSGPECQEYLPNKIGLMGFDNV